MIFLIRIPLYKVWLYLSFSLQPEQHATEHCDITALYGFWWQINKLPWDLGPPWVRWRNTQKRAHLATAFERALMASTCSTVFMCLISNFNALLIHRLKVKCSKNNTSIVQAIFGKNYVEKKKIKKEKALIMIGLLDSCKATFNQYNGYNIYKSEFLLKPFDMILNFDMLILFFLLL